MRYRTEGTIHILEFEAIGASIRVEVNDTGTHAEVSVNGKTISDAFGHVIPNFSGLHGAARQAVICKIMREYAECTMVDALTYEEE